MRFTKSQDGVERASILIIVRIDRETVLRIRKFLKKRGDSCSDQAVREFVKACNENGAEDWIFGEDEEDT